MARSKAVTLRCAGGLRVVVHQLTPVTLTSGDVAPTYRTRQAVRGIDRTVVVRSAALADGQRLAQTERRPAALSTHPRGGRATLEVRVRTIVNHQYVREVMRWHVLPADVEPYGRRESEQGAHLRPLDQNVAALGDRFARDALGHSLYIKPLFGTRSASGAFTPSDG
jgi:hypothetical protein